MRAGRIVIAAETQLVVRQGGDAVRAGEDIRAMAMVRVPRRNHSRHGAEPTALL